MGNALRIPVIAAVLCAAACGGGNEVAACEPITGSWMLSDTIMDSTCGGFQDVIGQVMPATLTMAEVAADPDCFMWTEESGGVPFHGMTEAAAGSMEGVCAGMFTLDGTIVHTLTNADGRSYVLTNHYRRMATFMGNGTVIGTSAETFTTDPPQPGVDCATNYKSMGIRR